MEGYIFKIGDWGFIVVVVVIGLDLGVKVFGFWGKERGGKESKWGRG